MQMNRLGRGLVFAASSVVSGLALAFVIVAARPDLVRRGAEPLLPPQASSGPPVSQPMQSSARVTYADAVTRASPAVVNIHTARLVQERVAPTTLSELFGDNWPRFRRRVERSLGSGVIVDANGHIVTNQHVIANADEIRVQLADSRIAVATIVGRDPDTDLAVLRIDLDNLPVMPMGRSDRLKVGDVVLAIGNPIGLSQTVTHGIVSATSRSQLGVATFEEFIQTDAPINFGNSGGALIDTSGELVGINTAIVAKDLGVEGIGFAIPVNMVRGVLSAIIANGRVIRGWIGVELYDISDDEAEELGLARAGVMIGQVYVRSPALQAGLQVGDLVTEIDGGAVRSAQEAIGKIATHHSGDMVKIKALRGRKPIEVTVRVTEKSRRR